MSAETLREFHETWAWVILVSNAVVGIWAIAAHWVQPLRRTVLWWCVAAAEMTAVVQVFVGVALVRAEDRELPELHALYGFSGLIAVGVLYGYRVQMRHRIHLLYGGGSLFLMGLAIRAMVLGAT